MSLPAQTSKSDQTQLTELPKGLLFEKGNLEFGREITEIHISNALFYRCLQVASGVFDMSVDMTTDAVER